MNVHDRPPLKTVGVVFLVLIAAVLTLVFLQFRGDVIGRVANVSSTNRDGKSMALVTLDVDSHYLSAIPSNVHADIKASTVFGNKYVALTTPKNPSPARITSADAIDASTVTTEFNTLFETITSIAEKVDPIRLNLTCRRPRRPPPARSTPNSRTWTRLCWPRSGSATPPPTCSSGAAPISCGPWPTWCRAAVCSTRTVPRSSAA